MCMLRTRCPVSAAEIASAAVSRSLSHPPNDVGSCSTRPDAKVGMSIPEHLFDEALVRLEDVFDRILGVMMCFR